ncbi:MAG: DNA-packaging protein [Alphaproteobacteria bacterium]|nr:DNA-packaging protein [Alphaproteobacteria bacterium]
MDCDIRKKQLKEFIRQEYLRRQAEQQQYAWHLTARSNQRIPEGPWKVWLILAGRGFGKTRTGAETIRSWVMSGAARRVVLIGHTHGDARRVMVEGESGLLGVHPPHRRPHFYASQGLISWQNGAKACLFTAERPDQLRGPQFDAAWVDELAKFSRPQEIWDQLMFSLRKGTHPRVIVTTTPRPSPLLKELLARQGQDVFVTRGATFDNAPNLAKSFLQEIQERYAHTRLGAQELYGELIEETHNSLWSQAILRACYQEVPPPLVRVVVAVDPAVTSHKNSDETGIIVAGRDAGGRAFILDDLSGRYRPQEWATKAIAAFHHYQADRIIAEVNQGGDLVEQMLRSQERTIPYKAVRATRGKLTRAEPVANLYTQARVFHTGRGLGQLERQLCEYQEGDPSPDRLDALVWAVTELLLGERSARHTAWSL